jgi:hypothetical protein
MSDRAGECHLLVNTPEDIGPVSGLVLFTREAREEFEVLVYGADGTVASTDCTGFSPSASPP